MRLTHIFQVFEDGVYISIAFIKDGEIPHSSTIALSDGHALLRVLTRLLHPPWSALCPIVVSSRVERSARSTYDWRGRGTEGGGERKEKGVEKREGKQF